MFKLHKINPMARAIGTMGAVAALVGGVTFATLQSNTVALSPNQLTTASASLAIEPAGCDPASATTSTPGMNGNLTPGSGSVTKDFCLVNNGNVPLDMFAIVPDNLSGSNAAAYTNMGIHCSKIGDIAPVALTSWGSYQQFDSNPLNAGATASCTVTATLSSSYSGSGNESIPAFSINFVGNQHTTPTP